MSFRARFEDGETLIMNEGDSWGTRPIKQVQLCCGLHDKNMRTIYEGDLVYFDNQPFFEIINAYEFLIDVGRHEKETGLPWKEFINILN